MYVWNSYSGLLTVGYRVTFLCIILEKVKMRIFLDKKVSAGGFPPCTRVTLNVGSIYLGLSHYRKRRGIGQQVKILVR